MSVRLFFLKDLADRRNYEPLVRKIIKLPFDEVIALGDTPEHSLTLILLLDQFTRNFSRDTPFPFIEVDPLCQKLAKHFVLSLGHDREHPPYKQIFYYLPFQHAERLDYQELAVSKQAYTCWETRDGEWKGFHEMMSKGLDSAWKHYVIIAKFGRFPHRNEALGRQTTEEEKKFLDEGGDTFAPPKSNVS
jgi:uncharacterized protein (DUF924 family)